MAASSQIDPQTGERIGGGSIQIDPNTGERVPSTPPKQPGLTDYVPPRTTPASNFTEGVQEFVRPANNMFSAALKSGGDFAKSMMAPPPQQSIGSRIADVVAGPAQPALHAIRGLVSGARQSYKEGGMDKALTDTVGPAAVGAVGGELGAQGLNAVPRTSRAVANLERVNQGMANEPVKLNATNAPLQRAVELGVRGGKLPTPVRALLERSQSPIDMTFPEARDYQSNLSDLSREDANSMNRKMGGQVKQLNKGYFSDLKDAADAKGLGEDYAKGMKEYRQAAQLKAVGKNVGKAAAIGAGGAAIGYPLLSKIRGLIP